MSNLNRLIALLLILFVIYVLQFAASVVPDSIGYECSQGCPNTSLKTHEFNGMIECLYHDSKLENVYVTIRSEVFHICRIKYKAGNLSSYTLLQTGTPVQINY